MECAVYHGGTKMANKRENVKASSGQRNWRA